MNALKLTCYFTIKKKKYKGSLKLQKKIKKNSLSASWFVGGGIKDSNATPSWTSTPSINATLSRINCNCLIPARQKEIM